MKNTEEQIRIFLNQICSEFGICDHLYNLETFVDREQYEVNEFLREIFKAERLDPDMNLNLFRQVKKMFVDRFGTEVCVEYEIQ